MSIQELRKEQARNLRYKKPIAKGLNWQDIWDDLYEMYEGCTLVIWFMDDDKETLLESLNDDESEVEEYKIAFSTLEADCDQLMGSSSGRVDSRVLQPVFCGCTSRGLSWL